MYHDSSYALPSKIAATCSFSIVHAICEKIWHLWVQARNFVRLCIWSLLIILDMWPRQFHPVDKMAAILLTPLPEISIFVISPQIFNTSLILKCLCPGFHGQ